MKGGNESLFLSLSLWEKEKGRERRVKEKRKRKRKREEGKKERWIEWNGNCTLWHGVVKFINMALEIKVLKKWVGQQQIKKKTLLCSKGNHQQNKITYILGKNSHKSYVKRS